MVAEAIFTMLGQSMESFGEIEYLPRKGPFVSVARCTIPSQDLQ
jgi:hypothetical protein